MPDTKIMTFLTFKSLFPNVEKNGVLIPLSYLNDFNNVESLIDHIIKDFDNHEAVSYSSFLNGVVQACNVDETEKLGLNEMAKVRLVKDVPNNGILFYRDNLLFMIEKSISKNVGTLKITGQETYETANEYYKALLLISEIVPSASLEKDHLIRSYPYYYLPESAAAIYELRLQRYWHIYNHLLPEMADDTKNHLQSGIELIEEKANLSLQDYFSAVTGIYTWFLKIPNLKKSKGATELEKVGFDHKNIDSFYIKKGNFGESDDLIKLIEHLALDIEDFKKEFKSNSERKYPITGFYKNFQTLFDHPIFKIDENNFCLIDFKFLFEGLCSGFMWHINSFSDGKLQSVKEQYGYLLESYFVELLKKIFGETHVQKPEGVGIPDAILETDDYIIVLEFTTEYYRFASLYSEETDLFKEDLKRILFNDPSDAGASRSKKDRGKFIKLNSYIEPYNKSGKTILPVLVTENYLGDFDLLERFDQFISEGMNTNKLENLKVSKPTILNLDDFEIFWQFAKSKDSINQFAEALIEWGNKGEEKGTYHFLFSYFVSEANKKSEINSNFSTFFNFKTFTESLKSN